MSKAELINAIYRELDLDPDKNPQALEHPLTYLQANEINNSTLKNIFLLMAEYIDNQPN